MQESEDARELGHLRASARSEGLGRLLRRQDQAGTARGTREHDRREHHQRQDREDGIRGNVQDGR